MIVFVKIRLLLIFKNLGGFVSFMNENIIHQLNNKLNILSILQNNLGRVDFEIKLI